MEKQRRFLFDCRACKHRHLMELRPCPSCGGAGGWTPQPVSGAVYGRCHEDYDCDGCVAYRDRYR